jgi:hypothetical protein
MIQYCPKVQQNDEDNYLLIAIGLLYGLTGVEILPHFLRKVVETDDFQVIQVRLLVLILSAIVQK